MRTCLLLRSGRVARTDYLELPPITLSCCRQNPVAPSQGGRLAAGMRNRDHENRLMTPRIRPTQSRMGPK